MTDDLTIRAASPADLDALVVMYQATQQWLAEKGSNQWATNTAERVRAKLTQAVERGECFVAENRNGIVGTITVDDFADPEFWSDDEPESALYVHRMMVDRSAAGQNIGGRLLDYAEEVAARAGKKRLRLDAWRTNKPLHEYYMRQGLDLVRIVSLPHRGSGALFERAVRTHR
ncbi:GNAT family N-acetyltransferase [Actinoplanes sp. NPDC024001]|uniref:GNAT family N-acetyltransferase n=1 Tax=Actinoplanes sp. NPDC024001 TaxID=3154598 RepID=UPI0033FE46D8